MKRKNDPRHLKRIKVMQGLFTWDFNNKQSFPTDKQKNKQIREITDNLESIDQKIKLCAPDRPLGEINKIDLAILRLSIFELIIKKGVPPKVAIDEAVELAKEYGSDSSPAFINGALGKLITEEGIETSNG